MNIILESLLQDNINDLMTQVPNNYGIPSSWFYLFVTSSKIIPIQPKRLLRNGHGCTMEILQKSLCSCTRIKFHKTITLWRNRVEKNMKRANNKILWCILNQSGPLHLKSQIKVISTKENLVSVFISYKWVQGKFSTSVISYKWVQGKWTYQKIISTNFFSILLLFCNTHFEL